MLEIPEADLVKRAQRGQADAIGTLYDRYHSQVFRYIWAYVRDKQLAEDLTGDVFTRLVTKLPEYQNRGVPFQAWLYRIARNLVIDHSRKNSHKQDLPLYHAEDVSNSQGNPSMLVERQLTADRLQTALHQIKKSQQEIIILRFIVGLSISEVAATLNKSTNAVKALQHRGLKSLHAVLKDV